MTDARTTLPTGLPMTTLDVDDPFRGERAVSVPMTSWEDVGKRLDKARAAAAELRAMPVDKRVALCDRAMRAMEARADEIARDITRQMGKPIRQSKNEIGGMVTRARVMMELASEAMADIVLPPQDKLERRIVREPLGVVLDLPAWNYPLLTAVNAIVPAVLAGNAVMVRHSPRTPLCGEHFARAFRDAGAPANLVQALYLDHPTTERVVGDERVDHVVFTGSGYGGLRIVEAASKRFLHPTLELGGNDPAYVAPDCDFEKTVENVVDGAMYNAGQSCCAVERVYVHESLYGRFVEACEALVRAYVLGDPMDEKTTMGPIAQPHHVAELEVFVADARQRRARCVAGGERMSVDGKGRFFQPTLLADVPQEARLMQDESFGPILPVAKVASDEEAMARMNDSRLGLTASVWTKDRDRAMRMARELEYGTVYMNRCDAVDAALPWVGVKCSGKGWSLSRLAFETLTRPKSINFKLTF